MGKNVLELTHEEAKEFFLKEESYCAFDLPKYFSFGDLLGKISKEIDNKDFSSYYVSGKNPKVCENLNYKIFHNKDGHYARRCLELIHPAIYVALVHKITEKNNWKTIINSFNEFKKNSVVECFSIPQVPEEGKNVKETQIFWWRENMEQNSIALGLDYDFLIQTDIIDCYGSIYTHAIPWALHTRSCSKAKKHDKSLIGNIIDGFIQDMSYGQTNGIPQGNILMDFIAEIVLGYVDVELSQKIKDDTQINDYKILRYRDDYRIFVNNPTIGEKIIKNLTNILSDVGMRINQEKTNISKDVICTSIKSDKLFVINNYKYSKNIENELINIDILAGKFPKSTQARTMLYRLFSRIGKGKYVKQNKLTIISILVDIAYKNPNTYAIVSTFLSKFLDLFEKNEEKIGIISKIKRKFEKIPNTEYLDLWIQRFLIAQGVANEIYFKGNLCKKVLDKNVNIWDTNWLKGKLKKIIDSSEIINTSELENLTPVISKEEVEIFTKKGYYG